MNATQVNIVIAEHFGAKWIWKWKNDGTGNAVKYLILCWPEQGYDYAPDSECQKRMKGLMGEQTLATRTEIDEALRTDKYELLIPNYVQFLEDGKRLLTYVGCAYK